MSKTDSEKWKLLEDIKKDMAELRSINERMIHEMQKQDTELRQLRRAVFGYAYENDYTDPFLEGLAGDLMDMEAEELAQYLKEHNEKGD